MIFEEKSATKSESRQVHYPLQTFAIFGDPRNLILENSLPYVMHTHKLNTTLHSLGLYALCGFWNTHENLNSTEVVHLKLPSETCGLVFTWNNTKMQQPWANLYVYLHLQLLCISTVSYIMTILCQVFSCANIGQLFSILKYVALTQPHVSDVTGEVHVIITHYIWRSASEDYMCIHTTDDCSRSLRYELPGNLCIATYNLLFNNW